MRVWYFSEMAYHPAWQEGLNRGSLRVVLPNGQFDPQVGHGLLNRYLDEFAYADEVGLDIMVNEHHSTVTCLTVSVPMALAIIARETKTARLLTLGNPIANRPDPVRVAEEMAWLDVLSGGRLEMGLVKGAPYEIAPANSNPARLMRRYWEAHDLILKALSTTDGPFNWEGEYFHYRNVNIWPRPLQQPTPPIWMTSSSAFSSIDHAKLDYTCATFLSGAVARSVFDGYRKAYLEAHGRPAPDKRLAYLGVVAVAGDRKAAFERAEHMKGYFSTAARLDQQFRNPAGFNHIKANVKMLQAGPNAIRPRLRSGAPLPSDPSIEQYIDAGLMFVGTPDDVYEQIKQFYVDVGGFGNLLMMGQAGTISHEDTVDNLSLFAKHVMPRLQELSLDTPEVRYEAFA